MRQFHECFGIPYLPETSDRAILGVPIKVSSRAQAVRHLDSVIEEDQRLNIAFANAHTLSLAHRRSEFCRTLQGFHVLNDGLGVDLASRMKFGTRFPENLNGTDFLPYYFANSRQELRIFLLGGRPKVVAAAAGYLRSKFPRHAVVGYNPGYFTESAASEICERIRDAGPNVLLVGMGNPLQEFWISRFGPRTGARLMFGVGALFDFLSGTKPRAPSILRRMRCEWIFRLMLEPKRLWRRYLLGNAVFLTNVLLEPGAPLARPSDPPLREGM